MSDPELTSTATEPDFPNEAPLAASTARTSEPTALKVTRRQVAVHRLDGGLERGESDARALSPDGFPIYTPPDLDRARWIPARDIKYVVFGSLDDPDLEADPGEKSQARKAILRFRDGEWIAAYMDAGQPPDGAGLAIKIRLTERQRVIPAIAANAALLEMQFVDLWATSTDSAQPHRRRSDIVEAAARQGRDLTQLANDFRDRLALIRDVGLTSGDTLAFSRAVRTHLDRFLAEDGINLNSVEKSALADIILRAAVGYGPLDSLLHDRSVSEIMVNGPDQVFIERRGVLTKADIRFEDENQLLETIRRMVATTGRHIDGLNPMVDARLPDGSRVNAIIRPGRHPRRGAHDQKVQGRRPRHRRPHPRGQPESRNGGVPQGRGARPHERPGLRRNGIRQDHDPQCHRALHPAQPARDHDRGRRRAADRPPARDRARAPPGQRRRQG